MPDVRLPLQLTFVAALALASCGSERPEQINLILQMKEENPRTMRHLAQSVARTAGMRVNEDVLTFGGVRSTAYLLYDGSRSVTVLQAMDNCPESVPPSFDPCFSKTRYSVSIARESRLGQGKPLAPVARAVADEAAKVGALVYLDPQAVQDGEPR